MTLRWLTCLSLGLNLWLGLALLGTYPSTPETTTPTAPPPRPPSLPTSPDNFEAPPHPIVFRQIAPFHWRDITSDDFFDYRDKLLAMECPEPTVKDILTSEVNRAYAERIETHLQPFVGRFWEIVADAVFDEDAVEEQFSPLVDTLEELDDERKELLDRLRESSADPPARPPYVFDDHQRALVDFLPAEKQTQYAALQLEFGKRWTRMVQGAQEAQQGISPQQRTTFQQEKRTALQLLLSPDEYSEYQLRTSAHSRLRDTRGIDLTDAELRTIVGYRSQAERLASTQSPELDPETYRILRERYGLDASQAFPTKTTPASAEDQIRTLLGDQRYAQLKRAENRNYQTLWKLGQLTGLSTDTVNDTYEIQRIAQAKAREVQTLPDLSPEENQALIQAIRLETENTLRQTLTPKQFKNYDYAIGRWWENLGE